MSRPSDLDLKKVEFDILIDIGLNFFRYLTYESFSMPVFIFMLMQDEHEDENENERDHDHEHGREHKHQHEQDHEHMKLSERKILTSIFGLSDIGSSDIGIL